VGIWGWAFLEGGEKVVSMELKRGEEGKNADSVEKNGRGWGIKTVFREYSLFSMEKRGGANRKCLAVEKSQLKLNEVCGEGTSMGITSEGGKAVSPR